MQIFKEEEDFQLFFDSQKFPVGSYTPALLATMPLAVQHGICMCVDPMNHGMCV